MLCGCLDVTSFDKLDEFVGLDDTDDQSRFPPEANMSVKTSATRKHGAGIAVKGGKTREPVAHPVAASHFASYEQTAVRMIKHGIRLSPKQRVRSGSARTAIAKPRPHDVGTVEVRLDPKIGSAAWRELLTMTIAAAADRVANIPEKKRSQMLASVKKRLTHGEESTISSDQVFVALHQAGLFRDPIGQAPADDPTVDRADPGADFEIPAANRAALARAFARAEANNVEILKRRDMLRGEEIGERLNLSRAAIDQRRVAGRLLALELGTKRGVRYPEWQCELVADAVGRAAFESVLAALVSAGSWARYRFFLRPAPELGGRTPIEALKAGEGAAVRRAAETWVAGEQGGH